MRIAALVKQVPVLSELELGLDGRLRREGLDLEMNAYCRRAVSQAVALVAEVGGSCTVFTLGPPSAEAVLREAIAWGDAHNVEIDGVLVSDRAFAGSDTLATARALAAALEHEGLFDLVLMGRNSIDSDTGQVGPELAQLLDLPFAAGVRHLNFNRTSNVLHLRCEHDDGWLLADVGIPTVISTAERLIEPCKANASEQAAVMVGRIRRLTAAHLGRGPWGQEASPTVVGPIRIHTIARDLQVLSGTIVKQVDAAIALLIERGALDASADHAMDRGAVPIAYGRAPQRSMSVIGVAVEPDRAHSTRELLGAAATLAAEIKGSVTALAPEHAPAATFGEWGADSAVVFDGAHIEEDIAAELAGWAKASTPWAILAPSTAWGREVAARTAAELGAGLIGDAVALEVGEDGRLIAWKPAFRGQLVAAIVARSSVQMATVRAGMLPCLTPRAAVASVEHVAAASRVGSACLRGRATTISTCWPRPRLS